MVVLAITLLSGRRIKPKPWNDTAISATYNDLRTEGTGNFFVVDYTLENHTDQDYLVNDSRRLHIAGHLQREKSLSFSSEDDLSVSYPLYIPARTAVSTSVHLKYPYPMKINADASNDAQHDYETNAAKYLSDNLFNMDGFMLLDDSLRYRISLPNGWIERAKQPLRTVPSDPKK